MKTSTIVLIAAGVGAAYLYAMMGGKNPLDALLAPTPAPVPKPTMDTQPVYNDIPDPTLPLPLAKPRFTVARATPTMASITGSAPPASPGTRRMSMSGYVRTR